MSESIFITGATGCIGHYVLDLLRDDPRYQLHLLCRDPKRLRFDYEAYPNIHIHIGNMETIETCRSVIEKMDYLIHIATDWSDSDYATLLNVTKTHDMFNYCSPDRCKRIIYFSTASILGKGNVPIPEAREYGTGYIRSKYLAFEALSELALADRIVTLFPTLVIGGDKSHPWSHISSGLVPNLHYLKFLRFLKPDIRFHFLHSQDIASVTTHLLTMENPDPCYVLGNGVLQGASVIREICDAFSIRTYFQIPVTSRMVFFLTRLLKITLAPWDRHCIQHPYFEYRAVSPDHFGMETQFPTFRSVLVDIQRQSEIT